MSNRDPKPGFAARPGDAERWIKTSDRARPAPADAHSARLTIDVTPAMRRQLKLVAAERGTTIADLLRGLIAREFPAKESRDA